MAYKDFLYSFIFFENKKKCNMRLMDVMEMDIRLTNGNAHFRMNDQIYQLKARVNVSGSYGYGYEITRSYSYR